MKQLEVVPEGFTPKLTNGEATLFISDADEDLAVMVNERTEMILELPTQSALARGYWEELPKP